MRFLKNLLVLALCGLLGWQGTRLYQAALAANRKPPQITTARVTRADLRITLSGYGTLEAANTFPVANQQVDSQFVDIIQDGAVVTKGEVVAQLDRTKIEKDLQDHRLAYETAKAQVKSTEADAVLNKQNADTKLTKSKQDQALLLASNHSDLDQAQAQVQFDKGELTYKQRDLARTQSLAKDLLVPASQVDEAELTAKSQELQLTQGQRQLDEKQQEQRSDIAKGDLLINDAKYSATVAKNKADEQIGNAKFNEEAARRLVELSEMQMKWCTIRAPAAGLAVLKRIYDEGDSALRPLRTGDPVHPGQLVMEIIDLAHMRVTADMNEMDISHLKVGQAVRVWPRSNPGCIMKGRVTSVSSLARPGDFWRSGSVPGKKVFSVLIQILESHPDQLRPGMTADFEVLEGQVPQILRVPLQAVFKTRAGTSVFVKKDRRFVPRPVKLGARNANYVAIVSGLQGDEEIALQRPPLELLRSPVTEPRPKPDLLRRTLGLLFKHHESHS